MAVLLRRWWLVFFRRRTGVRWGWEEVLRRSEGGRRMVVLGGPASRHGTVVFRRLEGVRRTVVEG